jgi:threonine synthase
VAGLRKAILQNKHAYEGKRIVCVLTGHGLKDPTVITDRMPKPLEIPAEMKALEEVLNA